MQRTIILTRSDEENRRIAPAFERCGMRTLSVPTIAIRSIGPPRLPAIPELDPPFVLLTSRNAADRWFALMRESGRPVRPAGYLVVGRRSADAIRENDPNADVVAIADSASDLLERLPHNRLLAGRPTAAILYPCSAKRREETVSGLRALGRHVTEIPLYEPAPPDDAASRLDAALGDAEEPVVVCFFSPSAVGNWFGLLAGDADLHDRLAALDPRYAAIGDTTADALRMHGVTNPVVADEPTVEALVGKVRCEK